MPRPPRSHLRQPGFRLGVYVFKDAEVIDYAAPIGVFSVARRFDPELDAFLVAEAGHPGQTQAGLTVVPSYCFNDRPALDAFLIAGRIVSAGGISAGMEMGFHLLRRAGYDESFIDEVARVME